MENIQYFGNPPISSFFNNLFYDDNISFNFPYLSLEIDNNNNNNENKLCSLTSSEINKNRITNKENSVIIKNKDSKCKPFCSKCNNFHEGKRCIETRRRKISPYYNDITSG